MVALFKRTQHFLAVDLWRIKLRNLPTWKRHSLGFLKIFFIAIREFIDDKCSEKASALTYLSMLSLVPVIAMIFAIAQGFGIKKLVIDELERYFNGQQEVLEQVTPLAERMLSTPGGGAITGISLVFLIYTVIRLLTNIENSFNNMWDIKENRRWERKISDYVAVILLGPLLVIIASSATIFVKDQIQGFIHQFEFLGHLRSGIYYLLRLLPYTILWLLLFGLYLVFPNTRVKVFPALLGGIIAGTLYQLNQQAFISFQFAFARYNAIYGSIAFLPLFLIWLQLSWLIVLFGAEIAYGAQYVNQWTIKSDNMKINLDHKKKLALLLLYKIVRHFERGEGPVPLAQLSESVSVPRKYINDITSELEKAQLVVRINKEDPSFQPAFDIHQMDIYTVLSKYEQAGMGEFDTKRSEEFEAINKALDAINANWKSTEKNILLKDLTKQYAA
jgi:membrane protein